MRISDQFNRMAILPGVTMTIWITLLLIASAIISNAQQGGTITGRVVNDEGDGMPNVNIHISQATTGKRVRSLRRNTTVITDKDGNFRAADLSPGLYTINVSNTKEYVMKPLTAAERRAQRYYRVGDNISISLVKGGVITGKVTNSDGRPMVGVEVRETMVRDAEGRPVRESRQGEPRMTDDRGIYRMYGLQPGSYLVSTNGTIMFARFSPYENGVVTYHPSSTHDTAAEVAIASGDETTGVDIRFRDEPGYVVSGTVTIPSGPLSSMYIDVSLISTDFSSVARSAVVRPDDPKKGFMIRGVTNGDYEIIANTNGNDSMVAASIPRRVTISGADITGLGLKMSPLASLSGKVLFEASSNPCENKSKRAMEEIMIYARSDDPSALGSPTSDLFSSDAVVNEKGEFTIPSLRPNRYRFEASLPDENWYIKSITLPAPAAARRSQSGIIDISRAGLGLKSSDKVTGVMVTVAEGAASLRGKAVAEKEGLPSRLRVHLAPVDAALANDVLRYADALMNNDGNFVLTNLAPGKYWLLLRPVPDEEPADRPPRPSAWDSAERARLRREAETKKIEVALKPCQRVRDFSIKF
jgi:protocatechuate 3,4-dioxygenase beta subunit